MAYQVIARKWRPQTFDEIVGQEHVTTTLKNAITNGRVGHAFLFTGIRGVGKTTAARVLAKALNCVHGPTITPCNVCDSCREITIGISMDVKEIDGASHRGIDSIRELREGVAFSASRDRHKIYIIDEVHMLTIEAFNALLKTLEEPPPHVIFIFATTEMHKVPATIASRCQVFEFKRVPVIGLVQQLRMIADSESISASDDALRLIAREADGSVRDACSLMDQVISFAGENMSDEDVGEVLRTGNRATLEKVLGALMSEDPAGTLRAFRSAMARGIQPRQFLADLARYLSECLQVRLLGADSALEMGLTEVEIRAMMDLVGTASPESLAVLLNLLVRSADEVADSRNPELLAQAGLIQASRLSSLASADSMIARLEAISRGQPVHPTNRVIESRPHPPVVAEPQNFGAPRPSQGDGPSAKALGKLASAVEAMNLSPRAGMTGTPESNVPSVKKAVEPTSPAPAQNVPSPGVAPRAQSAGPSRTDGEAADLFMKEPLTEKVIEKFHGHVIKVTSAKTHLVVEDHGE